MGLESQQKPAWSKIFVMPIDLGPTLASTKHQDPGPWPITKIKDQFDFDAQIYHHYC
jgi:hypothetical protein